VGDIVLRAPPAAAASGPGAAAPRAPRVRRKARPETRTHRAAGGTPLQRGSMRHRPRTDRLGWPGRWCEPSDPCARRASSSGHQLARAACALRLKGALRARLSPPAPAASEKRTTASRQDALDPCFGSVCYSARAAGAGRYARNAKPVGPRFNDSGRSAAAWTHKRPTSRRGPRKTTHAVAFRRAVRVSPAETAQPGSLSSARAQRPV
jgi:hypothetical protein